MKPFQFYIPRYPSWVEAEPLLKKIFFPWLSRLRVSPRKDSPHKSAGFKRHNNARVLRRRFFAKPGSGYWRMHTSNRKSISWKVERQLNIEILNALNQRNIDDALHSMRRYVSLPFEDTENRLWRKAFIQEFDGEFDKAIQTYKNLIKFVSQANKGGLSLLTYHLVRLGPEAQEHRRIRARYFIKEGALRCAVNELQVLKRLQHNNRDDPAAGKTLNAIKALVVELKRQGRLERCGPPEGEFSFDFDENDQVELDLEDVEV